MTPEGPSSSGPLKSSALRSALYPTRIVPLICGPWTRHTKR
jgi:hypothetical protein